ncbi:MAG: dephospho-CoA kinase [Candidatus Tumulicola sp.]
MRVGLTGGIGSGKSEVAALFEEFGALVIDTDALAREAAAPNGDGFLAIAREWPDVIRRGVLDRAALADVVFADPVARARLNAILHPVIRGMAAARERKARPGQLIVHVVPLLFETGYEALVDRTIVVVAPPEARLARILARDRLDEGRARARMEAQIAPEEARSRADDVIENDAGLGTLRERARSIYDRLAAA